MLLYQFLLFQIVYFFCSVLNEYRLPLVLTYFHKLSIILSHKKQIGNIEISSNIALSPERLHDTVDIRMKAFLNYTNNHYSENISLEHLAKSANASKSSILRCFWEKRDIPHGNTGSYNFFIQSIENLWWKQVKGVDHQWRQQCYFAIFNTP